MENIWVSFNEEVDFPILKNETKHKENKKQIISNFHGLPQQGLPQMSLLFIAFLECEAFRSVKLLHHMLYGNLDKCLRLGKSCQIYFLKRKISEELSVLTVSHSSFLDSL